MPTVIQNLIGTIVTTTTDFVMTFIGGNWDYILGSVALAAIVAFIIR